MYLTTVIVVAAVAAAHVHNARENVKTTGVNWYRLGIEVKMCKAV